MTSNTRKKMLEKVKAILAKTMDNGCTEDEAMTALAKARELMATYDIDEKELDALDQEKATIFRTDPKDPYEIKFWLAKYVGKFTRCRAWADKKKIVSFAGMESDVIFATWLLDTLQRFVMRALREFQKQRSIKGMTNSNWTSASFVSGCSARISEKLKELCPVEHTQNALVTAELAKNGIVLRKGRNSGKDVDSKSANAGYEAGNSARFDRPVGQGGRFYLK